MAILCGGNFYKGLVWRWRMLVIDSHWLFPFVWALIDVFCGANDFRRKGSKGNLIYQLWAQL